MQRMYLVITDQDDLLASKNERNHTFYVHVNIKMAMGTEKACLVRRLVWPHQLIQS